MHQNGEKKDECESPKEKLCQGIIMSQWKINDRGIASVHAIPEARPTERPEKRSNSGYNFLCVIVRIIERDMFLSGSLRLKSPRRVNVQACHSKAAQPGEAITSKVVARKRTGSDQQ
jgi:hypothetical protein